MNLDLFSSSFNQIYLDESSHRYILPDGTEYTSVTELIKKYEHEFNQELIAEKTAKKRKVSKEQLLLEWRTKGENSRKKGTSIHKYVESYFLGNKDLPKEDDDYFNLKIQFHNFYNDFMKDKVWIYSEKIIYHPGIKIAGTIDCLVYCPKEDIFYFIDWKTNDKLSWDNKYSFLKFPLNKYEASNLNTYSLQISLYRYIIEEQILIKSHSMNEVKDKAKNLIVLFSDSNNVYSVYETPYYKYSIVQLLNNYNLTKGK